MWRAVYDSNNYAFNSDVVSGGRFTHMYTLVLGGLYKLLLTVRVLPIALFNSDVVLIVTKLPDV